MNKKIIYSSIAILVILGGGVLYLFARPYIFQERIVEKQLSPFSPSVPAYKEVALDFVHNHVKGNYDFAGSALIDINNDGIEEVFIGGGENQTDGLFRFENGGFVNIASQAGFTNTTPAGGALSIDFDNDGDVDLLVARLDGVYLYTNNTSDAGNIPQFSEKKLNIAFETGAAPLSISATDINKDGLVDLYISTFKSPKLFRITTFNDPSNRSNNVMVLNKGNYEFEDITKKSGLTYNQNTFQVAFVDLNNDTWPDLVVAPNTDRVVVFKNNTDGTFTKSEPLTDFGFWMGLASADVDLDGDQDLFFSNIGNTVPANKARGDMRPEQILDVEWALLRNDGDFKFTNITNESKLTNYEFAWGAIFEDLNLDGLQDLLVVENYIKWPAHKLSKLDGRVFLQEKDTTYSPITSAAKLENPYYGTTALTSDFNSDGHPDVVFINFAGPSKAHLHVGGGEADTYLKVVFTDTAKSLGARVDVETKSGITLSKQIIGGTGLLSDSSSTLIFGLSGETIVPMVTITWTNGVVQRFENVKANETLKIK